MARLKSDKILRMPEVVKIVGMSDKNILRSIKSGIFPPQVKIGTRCRGWLRSDINQWLADLKQEKDNTDA